MEAKSLAITLLVIGLIAGSLIGSYGFPKTVTATETLTETTTETATITEIRTKTVTTTKSVTETVTVPAWAYTGTVLEVEGPLILEGKHYGYEIVWAEENSRIRVTLDADKPIYVYIFSVADYASWVYGEEVSPIAEKKASTIALEATVPITEYYIIVFYNDEQEEASIYSYKIEIQAP